MGNLHIGLRATLTALVLATFVKCSARSTAPEAAPVGSIGPRPDEAALDAPFSVVHAAPRGAAALGSAITVSFSEPLRALEAGGAPPPALRLEPAVKGEWKWVGSRALTFAPAAGQLPAATSFRVTVPSEVRSRDGDVLGAPYEFAFDTPAPRVVATEPEASARGQQPDARIAIEFNQPVPASAVQKSGRLSALRGSKREVLPFRAEPDPERPSRVLIVPRGRLPLAATVELRLAAGLQGGEGPRPLAEPFKLSFETYGPLTVVNVNCHARPAGGSCDPEGSIWIELSNPVRLAAFKQHLAIEPPVSTSWPEELSDESRYFYLPLSRALAPQTTYRVTVQAGLRDTYGQVLAKDEQRVLSMGDLSPRVRLPISGEIFPAPLAALPLEVRNAPGLRVYTRRLTPERLLDFFAAHSDYEQQQSLPERIGAEATGVAFPADNLVHQHVISLAPLLGDGAARGAAWLGWRQASAIGGQLIQVTDLALTAKLSAQGSLVWVTHLGTGAPVEGASVELVGRTPELRRQYSTDASGIARIPAEDYRPRLSDYGSEDDTLIFARLGADSTFRRVADFVPPWRLGPDVRLAEAERDVGLLFSERGIYRPGDVVKVKGIWRREAAGGNRVLADRKLDVQLEDPFGEVAEKYAVQTNRFGTFALDVRLPGSAALGQWRVAAPGTPEAALSVEVAEYRPAEFKVRVDAALPEYVSRQTAELRVQADYLYGSPMAGAKLSYAATRERTSFAPPGADGYVTDDEAFRNELSAAALSSAPLGRAEEQLSAQGAFTIGLPLTLPGQIGPERVRVDAEVTDVSRQVVSSSAAVLVHPAAYYVAIAQLDSWFVSTPSALRPRVLALEPDGSRVLGRKVTLDLVRRRWTVTREKTEGGWRTLSVQVDEKQASCELVTALDPVSCELPVQESGQFFVLASSADASGRRASAALPFYALGAGRPGFADNDERKLDLVLDKPQYRVGETARVLIKSPFERAEALFTIERAGIYEHRRLTLSGPTPTVEVPVDERFRPNAFVAVHLVQGVAANLPPSPPEVTPEPGYRIGYAELRVDPDARRLAVEIRGREGAYRPGERASFELSVTRAASGAPHAAELTVYAVDEGVLSLIGYEPPDPLRIFTRPRPLAVATVESREALGRLLLFGPGSDKGAAGGGGEDAAARSDFRTTAYFNPSVRTDAQGKARVEFELPDNLTTFRLMAVAVSEDDHYGVGMRPLRVNQPLMLRPALPRALRAGDKFQAAVALGTTARQEGRARVELALTGAKLLGPAAQELPLSAQGTAEARFLVEVADPGLAKFAFAATFAGERDSVELTRRVVSPAALETHAVYGSTESTEAQALGDLSKVRRDVGGLELQLSSTALVGLDGAVSHLLDYPYACTEQLASRLLPLGPLAELSARYGMAVPEDLPVVLEARAGEIARRQRGDGGFGLWPDSPESHRWLSAYALWVLWQTKQAGARIADRVFEQGVGYLRRELPRGEGELPELATAAFMLDVLAALGQPDPEYVTRIFEQRAALPAFARALLLHAAQAGGSDAALVRTLSDELAALVVLRGNAAQLQAPDPEPYRQLFHSEGRSEALALWALSSVDPRHPLAPPLARGVLDRRKAGHWQNTQESAYSLLALDAYRRAFEADVPSFEAAAWLGEQRLFTAAFQGGSTQAQSRRLGLGELGAAGQRLVFEKQGQGTLFYEARLSYAERELPAQPLDRGFAITRSVRTRTRRGARRGATAYPGPFASRGGAVRGRSRAGRSAGDGARSPALCRDRRSTARGLGSRRRGARHHLGRARSRSLSTSRAAGPSRAARSAGARRAVVSAGATRRSGGVLRR